MFIRKALTARLSALDSLRGIAAIWVVIFHFSFGIRFRWLPDAPSRANAIAPFHFNIEGLIPVYLFFMISGFVIFMTIEKCETLRDFAVARFARLFPAYWCCLLLTCAVAMLVPLAVQPINFQLAAANATMLQDFLGQPSIETVYWSLTHELVFYVIMGGIFALGWLERIEILGAAWLGLFIILFRIFPDLGAMIPWRLQLVLGIQFAPLFFAGILYYRLHRRGVTLPRIALLALCGFSWIYRQPPYSQLIILSIFGLFPLAIWGRLPMLEHPVLTKLGMISYPLYLVHQSLGFRIQSASFDAGLSAWTGFAIAVLIVITISVAIHKLVEHPAQHKIRAAWRSRQAAAGE